MEGNDGGRAVHASCGNDGEKRSRVHMHRDARRTGKTRAFKPAGEALDERASAWEAKKADRGSATELRTAFESTARARTPGRDPTLKRSNAAREVPVVAPLALDRVTVQVPLVRIWSSLPATAHTVGAVLA